MSVAEAPTVKDYGELKRTITESVDGFSKHLARVEDRLIQRIEGAESLINRRIDRVEDRLNERLDGIDTRLDNMETDMADIKAAVRTLVVELDATKAAVLKLAP